MSQPRPTDLRAIFDAVRPPDTDAREMGGSPAAVVNGNLFMRVRRDQLVLRLDEGARGDLLAIPGAAVFEPIPGRKMPEYVVVPPAMLSDLSALSEWVRRSHGYARSLAPQDASGVPKAQPQKQAAATKRIPRMNE